MLMWMLHACSMMKEIILNVYVNVTYYDESDYGDRNKQMFMWMFHACSMMKVIIINKCLCKCYMHIMMKVIIELKTSKCLCECYMNIYTDRKTRCSCDCYMNIMMKVIMEIETNRIFMWNLHEYIYSEFTDRQNVICECYKRIMMKVIKVIFEW
jgi:hypothetical protein